MRSLQIIYQDWLWNWGQRWHLQDKLKFNHGLHGNWQSVTTKADNATITLLTLFLFQLPYYIDGNVKLTQSATILRYLARKHGLGKWMFLQVDSLSIWLFDIFVLCVPVAFFSTSTMLVGQQKGIKPVKSSFIYLCKVSVVQSEVTQTKSKWEYSSLQPVLLLREHTCHIGSTCCGDIPNFITAN